MKYKIGAKRTLSLKVLERRVQKIWRSLSVAHSEKLVEGMTKRCKAKFWRFGPLLNIEHNIRLILAEICLYKLHVVHMDTTAKLHSQRVMMYIIIFRSCFNA